MLENVKWRGKLEAMIVHVATVTIPKYVFGIGFILLVVMAL